jgi:phenylpropionate dioxygenase-like ring-hydroxylating dioxygenase large terminal subunit
MYSPSPQLASFSVPLLSFLLYDNSDIPYSWETLLENVLDVSHVPFTHHQSVGNRKNATPVDLKVRPSL